VRQGGCGTSAHDRRLLAHPSATLARGWTAATYNPRLNRQTVVRRLFSDAEFRARAIADPSAALEEYRLATAERTALTKLCVQLAADGSVGSKQQLFWH
jgi:hypothetical protein